MFTYKRENPGEGDNYFVDVYRFTLDIDDSDVNFQEAEIDGYMFASIDEDQSICTGRNFPAL